MSLFIPSNNINIDPSKKSIVFVTNKIFNGAFDHIYGFGQIIIEYYKSLDNYNVIIIGYEKAEAVKDIENCYYFNTSYFMKLTENFHRKVEDQFHIAHNQNFIFKEYRNLFRDLDVEKIFILGDINFILPLIGYDTQVIDGYKFKDMQNEYFDYVGNSSKIMDAIDLINKKIVKKYNGVCNLLAYTMYVKNIFPNVIKYLYERSSNFDKVYNFIIDPAFYTPFFTYNQIPLKNYYFADDHRGTRNFFKFPIAELQHLIYEVGTEKVEDLFNVFDTAEKNKDFFFMGSILQSKGKRKWMWDLFLNDLELDPKLNSLYVPLVMNGVRLNASTGMNVRRQMKAKEKLPELVKKIMSHKLHKGDTTPSEITSTIQNYKYGLILRCVSLNDSLNFRLIKYLSQDILPFFDFKYDPSYLQVPKTFQDKLEVFSFIDIEEKISYYNNNDDKRLELLSEMKKHYKIDNFVCDLKPYFKGDNR